MFALLPILLFAAAQDAASAAAPAPPRGRAQVFVSPAGEPFRSYGEDPYPIGQWFAAADANHDGKIDFAEFDADFIRFFDQLDVDHDGSIDAGEKQRYETQVAPETNGGTVSRRYDAKNMQYDQNSGSFQDKSGEEDPNQDKIFLNKKKGDYAVLGAARYDLLGLPEPVAAMDTQLRGRISHNDAHDAARLRFRQLDSQNRGFLTLDALPRTFSQRGGR